MNKLIKQVLDLIVNELTNNQLQLGSHLDDGRFNSITNEKQIIQFLLTNPTINNFLNQNWLPVAKLLRRAQLQYLANFSNLTFVVWLADHQ